MAFLHCIGTGCCEVELKIVCPIQWEFALAILGPSGLSSNARSIRSRDAGCKLISSIQKNVAEVVLAVPFCLPWAHDPSVRSKDLWFVPKTLESTSSRHFNVGLPSTSLVELARFVDPSCSMISC